MKRVIIYLSVVCLLAVLVVVKIFVILDKRNTKTISITNEKKQYGKPIEIYKTKKEDLKIYERLTGKYNKESLNLYISKLQWKKIKIGMKIKTTHSQGIIKKGKVTAIDKFVHPTTGLYSIRARLINVKDFKQGQTVIVDVNVSTLKNIIKAPSSSIKREGNETYVWVLKNGQAVKKRIDEGSKSENFTQILKGISTDESVIIRGGSALQVGDTIRVIEGEV